MSSTSALNPTFASAQTVAQSLSPSSSTQASAASSAASSSASSSASAGQTVTANDFLTLLVTEMKNQDPTQPTDPNAYIQQMVEVNSLQQLISINQDLTPATSSTAAGSGASTPATAAIAAA